MREPKVPPEIIQQITLKAPEPIKKTVTLIRDTRHTKQYSIKIPISIIEEVHWKAGDKIQIEITDDSLKLTKTKAD